MRKTHGWSPRFGRATKILLSVFMEKDDLPHRVARSERERETLVNKIRAKRTALILLLFYIYDGNSTNRFSLFHDGTEPMTLH